MTRTDASTPLILVVEDEAIVALDLCMNLEERGYGCLGPAGSVRQAMDLIADRAPDAAVLDANLRGETPRSLAEELARRGVPFVYVSGYSADYIRSALPRAPLVPKPVSMTVLVDRLEEAIRSATERA